MVQILKNGEWIDFGEEIIPYDYTRTLDETLDSCKITLYNEISTPLEPSTLLKLDDEVWYVNTDKTLQKSGGKIQHTIQLDELTQLLNDRYLGNVCNSPNTYSLGECIDRLLLIANSTDIKVNYGDVSSKEEDFDLKKLNNTIGRIIGDGSYAIDYGKSEENDYIVYTFPNYGLLLSDFHIYFSGTVSYQVDDSGYGPIYEDFNDKEITKEKFSVGGLTFEFYLKDNNIHFSFRRVPISPTSSLYYRCNGVNISNMYFTYKTYKIDIMQMSKYFSFEDTNLFNALSQVCRSINMFPRLKYNDGLELNFDYIGINYDSETNFSEIEDIEVIRELSRNSNANIVLSNVKNLSSNDYVWYPNSEYGKQLIPSNQGTTLKQDGIGIFYCNSNIKNVRTIKVFPQIEVYLTSALPDGALNTDKLLLKTYYDEDFVDTFKKAMANSSFITSGKADEIAELYRSKCTPGYVIIGEDGRGYYHWYKSINTVISQGDIVFYAKEKKQYDLLAHDYLFDRFKIDSIEKTIYWEQGSNYIRGFDKELYNNSSYHQNAFYYDGVRVDYNFSKARVKLAIEYQPMIDTKVVQKNNSTNGIIKQYNQSDKMVDLDSYNRDLKNYINNMESKDVLVNAYYDDKSLILKPGSIMYDDENKIKYVVTNVSVTNFGNNNYDVIYQLNEEHVRRSEYISANSDIRDYNIPLTNTVKRTTTYIDDIVIDYNPQYNTGYANKNLIQTNFLKRKLSDNGYWVDNDSLIAIFKTTYSDESFAWFVSNPVQLRSGENNSIIYSINIDDNAIIGWNKYNGGYTASGLIENIFSLDLNNLYALENSKLVYHPIRYTDTNGRLVDLQLYLFSEGEIRLNDYNNGTNNLRLIYENYPNITEEFLANNIFNSSNEYVNIQQNRYLKDKYETICLNYQVNYKGTNGIELFNYINNEIKSNCIVKLYDKNKYRYINKNTLLEDDYIESEISDLSINNATISFTIDTEENLNDYIIMVCSRNGENIICLNNHNLETNEVKLYMNFDK